MRYTDESRERVRDAVDFVALVGEKVQLRKAGADRWAGRCPFHEERSPSFGISPSRKVFHCFGCGEGGDVFRYIMLTQNLDFAGALEELASRTGVALEAVEEDPGAAQRRKERERLHELLERTAAYYVRYLWQAEEAAPARAYLAERGLQEATLREFRVGYAPSRHDALLGVVRSAGFTSREAWDAGLAARGRHGGRLYDRFRRRITFPLTDARGRVLGFGARALTDGQGPKYLNSNDNALFHKSKVLFAQDLARPHAAKAGSVIAAEGYTDVLMLHQAGLRNSVGVMGTAVTEEQVGELARLAPTVLLALDADSAGQEAMLRAARVARGQRLELRVLPLPPGSDPADLVQREGPDAVRALADQSVPFVRFRVLRTLDTSDLTTAEGKDAAIDALRPVFAELPPSAQREELVATVADRTGLAPALVGSWLAGPGGRSGPSGGVGGPGSPGPSGAGTARLAPPPAPAARLDPVARTERALLAHCLALPEEGAARLRAMDLDQAFTSELTRRAAVLVRDHAADPAGAIPAEDERLGRFIAQLAVRAGELQATPAALEAQALWLELVHLERALAAGGGDVFALQRRRADLVSRRDALLGDQA